MPVWWLLLYAMIAVFLRARQTREQLRERELAATRAELQALRARLDPHFLFNTLHSLGALVRGNPDAAEDAIEHFADMMRYVLRTTRTESDVRLAEEIHFVRDYLALEQLRFAERLRVVEALDEEALGCRVPPLLLQPLVENALRHGLGPLPQGGTVRIAAWCSADRLHLEVSDDGRGSGTPEPRDAGGVGLESVRRQLAARFPERHDFSAASPEQGGFVVRLAFPRGERGPARRG
jgi:LytS/YehU family sensor histidine kinase